MLISVNWDVGLSRGEGFEEYKLTPSCLQVSTTTHATNRDLQRLSWVPRIRHEFNHVSPILRQQGTVVSFDFRTHPECGSTHVQVLPCERCAFAPRQTFSLLSDRPLNFPRCVTVLHFIALEWAFVRASCLDKFSPAPE